MKNIKNIPPSEITLLIQQGLELLIKGFENVGFRRKTNERLAQLEEQVALLSKKILED